jgi:hypothetical protein
VAVIAAADGDEVLAALDSFDRGGLDRRLSPGCRSIGARDRRRHGERKSEDRVDGDVLSRFHGFLQTLCLEAIYERDQGEIAKSFLEKPEKIGHSRMRRPRFLTLC